ncbi:hypothetical protein [Spirochaeta isovalerica]|uniref:Transglutaminase-like domain-containing protein n=1 Tax=Spirochaeta isovalerica TaxID=150 RepID=A0A841RED5_9SPIO|nr:hypothetical protein [Spirochaeta isovalerica]MBB6482353.1 hypothetical protein [Spirochaeta isovalerica]
MIRIKAIMLLVVFITLPLFGEEFFIEEYNYTVYIPEGWNTFDRTSLSELSFVSDDQTVIFQTTVYDGAKFGSSLEMYEALTVDFRGESDGERFRYNGDDAYLADITFSQGDGELRGWFLFINRDDRDYYLLSFSGLDFYEEKLPFILSTLDSFRIESENSLYKPGAISQFYYPFPGKGDVMAQMVLNGSIVSFQTDLNEFDASQAVIEREAQLMKYYQDLGDKPLFEEAWKRYYNIIYRDNYSRFDSLGQTLQSVLSGNSDREKAVILLNWIQNFKYTSSDTFSDLLSPISTVSNEEGDCDARGLSYSIMLGHLGIDSILLVSWQYKHSISAVNVPGDGARYPLGDVSYLVGETTEVVDLGMIPQSMADGEKWIPVVFTGD